MFLDSLSLCLQRKDDNAIILGGGLVIAALLSGVIVAGPALRDLSYDLAGESGSGLQLGDYAAALLWTCSLWFASPWQLLLLFLGKIETVSS